MPDLTSATMSRRAWRWSIPEKRIVIKRID